MTAPFISRLLAVLGAALALAGLVSGAYGPLPQATFHNTIDSSDSAAAAIVVFSLSSNGVLTAEIDGARQVFYVTNLSGDPMTVLGALKIFNIGLAEANLVHDIRIGLVRGYALIHADPRIIQALPAVAKLLNFGIEEVAPEEGRVRINMTLKPATGTVIFVVPEDGFFSYNITYRLVGYDRLTPTQAAMLGGLLVAAAVGVDLVWRKVTGGAYVGSIRRSQMD